MKIDKILFILAIVLAVFVYNNLFAAEPVSYDFTGESIQYGVQPVGKSEYKNLGMVDLKGEKVCLITLNSKVLFLNLAEKIYFYPESLLPYKTERITQGFWIKESRTEEYYQKDFTVTVKKFKGKKLVNNQILKSDGPIQNMNLFLFYLRKQQDLKIGWHFTLKILDELRFLKLDIKLISIDQISVPAGKFQAYHFKTIPEKFEIWIDKNSPHLPLKILVKGIVNRTILMKGYKLHNN